jgi:hypothetical protein
MAALHEIRPQVTVDQIQRPSGASLDRCAGVANVQEASDRAYWNINLLYGGVRSVKAAHA